MIKLILKMAVIFAEFAGCVLMLGYYFALAGAEGIIPWWAALALSVALMYLTGVLGEALFPQRTVAQKKFILTFSRVMYCAEFCVWFFSLIFIPVIAITVMIIVFEKKKKAIRVRFDEYLQKQGIPKESVLDTLILYSPWRLLRDKPAWIIEADFSDTPGIRRFFSEDGVILPERSDAS